MSVIRDPCDSYRGPINVRASLERMISESRGSPRHHPVVLAHEAQRAADIQLRIADAITAYAGSMRFVYVHIVLFAV